MYVLVCLCLNVNQCSSPVDCYMLPLSMLDWMFTFVFLDKIERRSLVEDSEYQSLQKKLFKAKQVISYLNNSNKQQLTLILLQSNRISYSKSLRQIWPKIVTFSFIMHILITLIGFLFSFEDFSLMFSLQSCSCYSAAVFQLVQFDVIFFHEIFE